MSSNGILARRRGAGRGLAFVVSGPSGAGKNSVINRVMQLESDLAFSVSYTTRPRRRREVEGVDYHYVSREAFERLLDAGELVEHVTYHEDLYGTGRAQIDDVVASGRDVILNVDVEGANALRERGLPPYDVVYVFLVPSSLDRLAERLHARGTESPEEIGDRLQIAEREMQMLDLFDYLVINDDFDAAVAELRAIIVAERIRTLSSLDDEKRG